MFKVAVVAILTMTVFLGSEMHRDLVADGGVFSGGYSLVLVLPNAWFAYGNNIGLTGAIRYTMP